jgi:hypothetical protein
MEQVKQEPTNEVTLSSLLDDYNSNLQGLREIDDLLYIILNKLKSDIKESKADFHSGPVNEVKTDIFDRFKCYNIDFYNVGFSLAAKIKLIDKLL